jgi:hypothetical protein
MKKASVILIVLLNFSCGDYVESPLANLTGEYGFNSTEFDNTCDPAGRHGYMGAITNNLVDMDKFGQVSFEFINLQAPLEMIPNGANFHLVSPNNECYWLTDLDNGISRTWFKPRSCKEGGKEFDFDAYFDPVEKRLAGHFTLKYATGCGENFDQPGSNSIRFSGILDPMAGGCYLDSIYCYMEEGCRQKEPWCYTELSECDRGRTKSYRQVNELDCHEYPEDLKIK